MEPANRIHRKADQTTCHPAGRQEGRGKDEERNGQKGVMFHPVEQFFDQGRKRVRSKEQDGGDG